MINIRFANPLFQHDMKSFDLIIFSDGEIIYRSNTNFKMSDNDQIMIDEATTIFNTLGMTEGIGSIIIDKPNGSI